MAIKVSGTVVIDNDRNANAGVVTATSLDVNPVATTFSPTDGSSDNALDTNIVITYNAGVAKGSGNITLREGSASGTALETIDVTSGNVSISGGEVTINPSSDLPTGKDIFVVVDAGCFTNSIDFLNGSSPLLNTYNFTTGPITVSSFSPSDGATDQTVSTNIVITFSENITKGSGNITLRASSASGTVRQTIDVTSGAVSVSGTQATINPPSNLEFSEDTYVVVDAGCFRNADGDVASGNAIINTYNFSTEADVPPLGGEFSGNAGILICCSSSIYWIVAPVSAEVQRNWYSRGDANTRAQQVSSCTGWFVPSRAQLQNPGETCKTYWNPCCNPGGTSKYWSDTQASSTRACYVNYNYNNNSNDDSKTDVFYVRSFRCLSY